MKVCTVGREETQGLARQLLVDISKQKTGSGATIVGLRGDLGAGKTTLVQGVALELGVLVPITSPTFILARNYNLDETANPFGGWKKLVHIDAYRLAGDDELRHIGWHDLVNDSNNLIFIEWPERVASALPANTKFVDCRHLDELRREISW